MKGLSDVSVLTTFLCSGRHRHVAATADWKVVTRRCHRRQTCPSSTPLLPSKPVQARLLSPALKVTKEWMHLAASCRAVPQR